MLCLAFRYYLNIYVSVFYERFRYEFRLHLRVKCIYVASLLVQPLSCREVYLNWDADIYELGSDTSSFIAVLSVHT